MTDRQSPEIVNLLFEYDQLRDEFRRAARTAREAHQAARDAYQKARDLEQQYQAKRQQIIDLKSAACNWHVTVELAETAPAAPLETKQG